VVIVVVLINLVLIGSSLGAYGWRMVRAVLPHGLLELAAYSLTLGLYVRVRQRSVPLGAWAASAGGAALLLAAAAILETYFTG
jgi:hypothetical protein